MSGGGVITCREHSGRQIDCRPISFLESTKLATGRDTCDDSRTPLSGLQVRVWQNAVYLVRSIGFNQLSWNKRASTPMILAEVETWRFGFSL